MWSFLSSSWDFSQQLNQCQCLQSVEKNAFLGLFQISELSADRTNEKAAIEEEVTSRLRQEMTHLEDQIQDKNRVC